MDEKMMCEHRPHAGAAYWCYLDCGHAGPHSNLTIMWDDQGRLCNSDGVSIGRLAAR